MSEVNYDYDWVEEERDLCDHFDTDCIADHDCINCWIMQEENKAMREQLEKEPQK